MIEKIVIEPDHVIEPEGCKYDTFSGAAPPFGNRFCLSNNNSGQVGIFEGPELITEFVVPNGSCSGFTGGPHPFKDILLLVQADSTIRFFDFCGKEIHKFRPLLKFNTTENDAGFDELGSFIYVGPISGANHTDSVFKLITWNGNRPIDTYGDEFVATDSIELDDDLVSSYQIQPTHINGLNLFRSKARTGYSQIFKIVDDKIELVKSIPGTSPITLSWDGNEFIKPCDSEDWRLERLCFDSAEPFNDRPFSRLGPVADWPSYKDSENPMERDYPSEGLYIDLVRTIFVGACSGELYILHTRSMTFEAEIEILGFEAPSTPPAEPQALARPSKPPRINSLRRCGDYLLVSQVIVDNQSYEHWLKLGLVRLSRVNEAINKAFR